MAAPSASYRASSAGSIRRADIRPRRRLERRLDDPGEAGAGGDLDPPGEARQPRGPREVAVCRRHRREVVEAERDPGDVARLVEQAEAVGEQRPRLVDVPELEQRQAELVQRPGLLRPVTDLAIQLERRAERRHRGGVVVGEVVLDADAPLHVGLTGDVAQRAIDLEGLVEQRVRLLAGVGRRLLEDAHREHEREVVGRVGDLALVADVAPDREGGVVVRRAPRRPRRASR